MTRKINTCIVFIFYTCVFYAQLNVRFVKHVSHLNLQTEHITYLNSIRQPSDTLEYFKARYYLQYFNDSLLLGSFEKSKTLCFNDPDFIAGASKKFLVYSKSNLQQTWFNALTAIENSREARYFYLIYNVANNPGKYKSGELPDGLRASFLNYKKVYGKKPVYGAVMSAVVPGLGKLYAGKAKSALAALMLNAGYALQTYESANKLGMRHPLTIINASAFAVFYLANVYGGYHAILDLRKERKKQFVADAATYFN